MVNILLDCLFNFVHEYLLKFKITDAIMFYNYVIMQLCHICIVVMIKPVD